MVDKHDRDGTRFRDFRLEIKPQIEKLGYSKETIDPYFISDPHNQLLSLAPIICNWSIGYWRENNINTDGLIIVSYSESMREGFCSSRSERTYRVLPIGDGLEKLLGLGIPLEKSWYKIVHKDIAHEPKLSIDLGELLERLKKL